MSSNGNGGGHYMNGDSPHDFRMHVMDMLGETVLAPEQARYGGYAYINDSTIVARSPITGLRPVIEQAIRQVKKANPTLTGEALENKVANQLTQLNDWANLETETQNEIMIMTGINFDAMTEAEREMTINHLQHSPLPFGDIEEVLGTDVTIDLGYTHTLDKNKTVAEHLGDGIYKVYMISNNNNGSHTGHNLGSFKIDLSDAKYQITDNYAVSADTPNDGDYNSPATMTGNNGSVWWPSSTDVGDVDIVMSFGKAVVADELVITGGSGYKVGAITKVELKDSDGVWHTVFTGETAYQAETVIDLSGVDFVSQDVRFVMQTGNNGQWEGITKVELKGAPAVEGDGSGLEDLAVDIGNDMVANTNNNNKLYLDAAAKDILYGRTEQNDFDHPEMTGMHQGHNFVDHAMHYYANALVEGQEKYGGYSWLSDSSIVARSPITALQPVIEQAIDQMKAKYPTLSGQAFERKVAQQITNLNDWEALTEATQAKLMIMTGINFDSMTAADREMTINHLLHSPLPFGDIEEVIGTDVTIDLGYTHTLDKNKTIAEHLGDGVYKVSMISNNNNGSHTGHNLGSFKIDLNDAKYEAGANWAIEANAPGQTTYSQANMVGDPSKSGLWYPNSTQVGDVTINMKFGSDMLANGLHLETSSYNIGNIRKVELKDEDGVWHTVWTGTTAQGKKTVINFEQTDFATSEVRFVLDTNYYSGWEAIDGVKLLGTPTEIGAGKEALAIQIGNDMVQNTNDNTKLYLESSARDILYGRTERADFTVEDPFDYVGEHVHGTSGNDTLIGGNGGDQIHGLGGNDGMYGGRGNDFIQGGMGIDTVIYDGVPGDYEFSLDAYGRLIVESAVYGRDVVTSTEYVYFKGSDSTYTIQEVLDGVEPEEGDTVENDPDADQYLTGTSGTDTFVIKGNSKDYSWAKRDDGSVIIWNATGHDVLTDFELIKFDDRDIDLTADIVGELNVTDVAGTEEYINGTDGYDTFTINGNSTDYQWAPSSDAEGVMVWNDEGFDVLYDFEAIKFQDQTVRFTGDGAENMKVKDEAGVEEYVSATDGTDTFVIDANSSDYNWSKTDDGTGILIWNDEGFDIIWDFETLRFNDKDVSLTGEKVGQTTVVDNVDEVEFIGGTDGTDTFVIDGNADDYGFAETDDGNGVVVYNESTDKYDFLYGFEEVKFNDETVVIQDELA
ncbi:MAG: hypothetical protein N4A65_12565 [Cohaesibacter sp.]|jgi:hypothetical protein|nr:hypothetical protein [Cohaesibacter sp.]